jgi:hypothetical protein
MGMLYVLYVERGMEMGESAGEKGEEGERSGFTYMYLQD